MALQVQHFPITINPGSTPAAPVTNQLQLGVFQVDWIEVETPNGVNGVVGFYVASSGQQIVPFRSGATPIWVVTNNSVKHWDLVDAPTSGDYQLVAYNQGGYPHLLQVTFGVELTGATVAGVSNITPVTSSSLSSE
jgi:hypothetical protein